MPHFVKHSPCPKRYSMGYPTRCKLCGGPLGGTAQFYVCSDCYRKNVMEAHRKLLLQEKSK